MHAASLPPRTLRTLVRLLVALYLTLIFSNVPGFLPPPYFLHAALTPAAPPNVPTQVRIYCGRFVYMFLVVEWNNTMKYPSM